MLLERACPGVIPSQLELMAQVTRYHRQSPRRPEHEPFAALNAPSPRQVSRLVAILRNADGLDRRHVRVVTEVSLRRDLSGWRDIILGHDGVDAELDAARRKAACSHWNQESRSRSRSRARQAVEHAVFAGWVRNWTGPAVQPQKPFALGETHPIRSPGCKRGPVIPRIRYL